MDRETKQMTRGIYSGRDRWVVHGRSGCKLQVQGDVACAKDGDENSVVEYIDVGADNGHGARVGAQTCAEDIRAQGECYRGGDNERSILGDTIRVL